MQYLTEADAIRSLITKLTSAKILWLDTEVADWQTPYPKLSLIQVLADPEDLTGDRTYIIDVLNKPELVTHFVSQIIVNPKLEKVFHNASYDLRFLDKQQAKNVTCTLKIARKITNKILQVTNLKLKTLATELCHFSNVDTEEQASDWGRRPLSEKQLQYAKMDTVYLAAVHRCLLEITNYNNSQTVDNIFDAKAQSFSATKVRVAFECPRLFYLTQHFGGDTLFLPADNPIGIGKVFHYLADKFVTLAQQESQFSALFKPEVEYLKTDKIATQMQQLFYQLVFFQYLQSSIQKDSTKAPTLLQVWQGLQGLIRRWAEVLVVNRQYCCAEAVIHHTFVPHERNSEHYFDLPDGTKKKVVGELDRLIFNFELQRLCVVEFKTYKPIDPSAQLAQVALYSYMLWAKNKKPVDSTVYCVLPEFKEYYYSWEQLAETVHLLIPHKLQQMQQWLTWKPPQPNPPPPTTAPYLCKICPQQQKCQTFFELGSSQAVYTPLQKINKLVKLNGSESPKSEKHQISTQEKEPVSLTPDVDAIAEKLVAILQSFKIGVDYQGAAVGSAFIRIKLKPHAGIKVDSIRKLSADLQVHLGIANPPLIAPQAGYVSVDLPRHERQIANFEEYIQHISLSPTAPVKIAIGVDLEGKLVEANLSDPNTCHFLVGGTTGSGKSEFLRSLLLSLLVRHSPNQVQIALVDPKRVTFPEFEKIPWLYSPIVKDSDRAIELMEQLVVEMEDRYQQFEAAECADLSSYNQQVNSPIPRIVCIFDEYGDLMAEKDSRNALEQSIKRLGAMARAAGIHLIVATQRPEAKVVTPIIRSNLPGRVALKTASEADSKIILGGTQTEAAYLLGKGDLLYQVGACLQRLQSLFASQSLKRID